MTVALAFERGVMGGTNAAVPLLRHFHDWAVESGVIDVADRPGAHGPHGHRHAGGQHCSPSGRRGSPASGGLPGLEGSMTKVFAVEAYQRATRLFQQMAGPAGLLQFHQPGAAADGFVEYDARHAPVTTIYGGTTEINRNNIAERHLKLPKAPLTPPSVPRAVQPSGSDLPVGGDRDSSRRAVVAVSVTAIR